VKKPKKLRGPTPADRKPVDPVQLPGRFSVRINERTLGAEKIGERWTFTCPAWPELVAEHNGAESAVGMVRAFVTLALAGAVTIEPGG